MSVVEFQHRFLIVLNAISIGLWLVLIVRAWRRRAAASDRGHTDWLGLGRTTYEPWLPETVTLGLATYLLAPALALHLTRTREQHWQLLAGSVSQLAAAALIGAVLYGFHWRYFRDSARQRIPHALLLGASTFILVTPLVLYVQSQLTRWIRYEHDTLQLVQADSPEATAKAIIAVFTAVVCAPLAEEFFYRLLLQGWLRRVFGTRWTAWQAGSIKARQLAAEDARHPRLTASPALAESTPATESNTPSRTVWPAILISSVVFAAMHWGQGPAPISLFLLSVGFGYLFDRTGSLLACIVAHMLLNGMTMAFVVSQAFLD